MSTRNLLVATGLVGVLALVGGTSSAAGGADRDAGGLKPASHCKRGYVPRNGRCVRSR